MRHLVPLSPHDAARPLRRPRVHREVRARVERGPGAAGRPLRRRCSWRLNAQAPGPVLRERWPLPDAGPAPRRRRAATTGRLSRRGAVRVHRLAWTVADLRGRRAPGRRRGRRRAAPAHGRAADARHPRAGGRVSAVDTQDERLARVALARHLRARRPAAGRPGGASSARWRCTEALAAERGPTPAHRRGRPAARGRPRARPGAGRAARHPLRGPRRRRVAAPARRPGAPPSRSRSAGGRRSGSGCAGPCASTSCTPSRSSAPARPRRTARTSPPSSPPGSPGPGVAVVSGAAFGIDQAAHRGALAAGGATVAVLACGVDRAYPAAHRSLLDHLAAEGAVVIASCRRAAPRPGCGSWPATG